MSEGYIIFIFSILIGFIGWAYKEPKSYKRLFPFLYIGVATILIIWLTYILGELSVKANLDEDTIRKDEVWLYFSQKEVIKNYLFFSLAIWMLLFPFTYSIDKIKDYLTRK